MLNQVILVGRIENMVNNETQTEIIIKVPRTFKNENGEYEEDHLKCILNQMLSNNVNGYCKINDVVGIKGRLQNVDNNNLVIAERLTFLSSNSNDEKQES